MHARIQWQIMAFKFKDGIRRNATRVPEERWNQHKKLICSLYQENTVEKVLETMKTRYNFVAR